jgi:methyl-accepting chemotaxis protein
MITVIIICAVGVILSVVLGLALARMISKPINKMVAAADLIALGDVDVTLDIDTKDETGKLAASLTNMIENIRKQARTINQVEQGDLTIDVDIRSEKDVLGKSLSGLVTNLSDLTSGIMSAADQVASGAQLVSNSSMTLSQGATEQASSIEELTASLEEISSQTSLNAKNAEKASHMATNAKTEAEQGNDRMNALLKAMDAINASSSNINKVIKVIDDIAFQTNILALNAAVEAARAGQHGKGFAVVAEEVRTLAGKSANAVKDTTEMIDGSIRNVQSGIKIANETAEALKRIVTEVSNATELVGAIAIASKEQALGIEQLNQGIVQVSQVVQNNAATAEESAAASEELSGQANQLKGSVSFFKVRNTKAYEPVRLSAASVRSPAQAKAQLAKIELEGNFGKY